MAEFYADEHIYNNYGEYADYMGTTINLIRGKKASHFLKRMKENE